MTEHKKRGRKRFSTDLTDFIEGRGPVSFAPSHVTREEMAYCMRETGVYNKSAVIALAIRYYHDALMTEAVRRNEQNL